jgi:hypothetical protein
MRRARTPGNFLSLTTVLPASLARSNSGICHLADVRRATGA